MSPFWVYILRCADGAYYTGHTDDLDKRVAEHHSGDFRGFTSERTPVQLVFATEMPTRDEALIRERQIKNWSREKKEALIDGNWERLKCLSRGRGR